MKLAACLALVAALMAGCAPVPGMDEVMGRSTAGTPTTEKRQLDCDLIFPGPDNR